MDGGHSAENIEEKPRNLDALAEGDGKPDPMKDNLSPDGLSPEPKDVETRTNCPGILDRKSPNRQVINSSPLIPFGDAPLNAESASTKPVADPKPEPVPATMADRKAGHSLLIDRPYGEIVATIYRAALLRTSLCQEHIEGVISQEACPVCAYDKRNHATHDVAGRRKAKTGASAEAVVRP